MRQLGQYAAPRHVVAHLSDPHLIGGGLHYALSGWYRTDDAGDQWTEISGNLPSDFGFPIDVHAHEPDTIYVVPIKSDSEHFPPEGKLRVYRSKTGGNEWEPLTNGLPQRASLGMTGNAARRVDKEACFRVDAVHSPAVRRRAEHADAARRGVALDQHEALRPVFGGGEARVRASVRRAVARSLSSIHYPVTIKTTA